MTGKHRRPEPASPESPESPAEASSLQRPLLLVAGVLALVVAVASVIALTRGDDDTVTTTTGQTPSAARSIDPTSAPATSPTPATSAPATPTPSLTPTPTSPAAPAATTPPPKPVPPVTLRVEVTGGRSWLTIRQPGGRTLVNEQLRKGAKLAFNQPVLNVIVGNSGAVKFTVNGKPRKPGAVGQVERFTVRKA
jgi:hypothetical protein